VPDGASRGLNIDSTYFRNDFSNLIAQGSVAGGDNPLAQGKEPVRRALHRRPHAGILSAAPRLIQVGLKQNF
jgi:hypothetical protein